MDDWSELSCTICHHARSPRRIAEHNALWLGFLGQGNQPRSIPHTDTSAQTEHSRATMVQGTGRVAVIE